MKATTARKAMSIAIRRVSEYVVCAKLKEVSLPFFRQRHRRQHTYGIIENCRIVQMRAHRDLKSRNRQNSTEFVLIRPSQLFLHVTAVMMIFENALEWLLQRAPQPVTIHKVRKNAGNVKQN